MDFRQRSTLPADATMKATLPRYFVGKSGRLYALTPGPPVAGVCDAVAYDSLACFDERSRTPVPVPLPEAVADFLREIRVCPLTLKTEADTLQWAKATARRTALSPSIGQLTAKQNCSINQDAQPVEAVRRAVESQPVEPPDPTDRGLTPSAWIERKHQTRSRYHV